MRAEAHVKTTDVGNHGMTDVQSRCSAHLFFFLFFFPFFFVYLFSCALCVCRSNAISSLMSQLAELKKNMTTLRSHSALQRAALPQTQQTHLLMPPQDQHALMPDEQ